MTTDSIDNWINYYFMYESYLFKHAPCDSASFQKAKSCTASAKYWVRGRTRATQPLSRLALKEKPRSVEKVRFCQTSLGLQVLLMFSKCFPNPRCLQTFFFPSHFMDDFDFPFATKSNISCFFGLKSSPSNPDFGSIISRHFEPYSDSSKTQYIFLLGLPKN